MKSALFALGISIFLLCLFFYKCRLFFGSKTLHIKLSDTYYVIGHWHILIFILLVLSTFFIVGGLIGTHFKEGFYIISSIILLSVDIFLAGKLAGIIKDMRSKL